MLHASTRRLGLRAALTLRAHRMYLNDVGPKYHAPSAPPLSTRAHLTEPRVSPAPSSREQRIEALSDDIFSKGNRHLKNVETLTSLPEGLHSFPEVCFIGKPNMGKSTLIASLLHNPKLAKGTSLPGTTRLLQFFNVGDALLLVDTPGYGGWKGRRLAQTAKERANAFSILFRYLALRKSGNLKRVYWVMAASAQHPMSFQPRDQEMYAFLSRERIPFTVVLSKIDRHWRHWAEETRAEDAIGKDGILRPSPLRTKYGGDVGAVERPEDGVRRNMLEIYRFLETDQVPILGVSANRWDPRRCHHLSSLQHDIVAHCTTDIPQDDRLTYKEVTALSYAPPLAADIQRVNVQYPVESFVVPQDDWLSLSEMVARHEAAKARLLERHVAAEFLTARDKRDGGFLDARELTRIARQEEAQRELRASVAQKSALLTMASAPSDGATPQLTTASSPPRRPQLRLAHTNETAAPYVDFSADMMMLVDDHELSGAAKPEHGVEADADGSLSAGSCAVVSGDETRDVTLGDAGGALGAPVAVSVRPPTSIPPLPFAIDRDASCVLAIDGTPIPRSLMSVSVEQLAVEKPDEMAVFALRSGAGAYEELIQSAESADFASDDAHLFVSHDGSARLSENELEMLQKIPFKSAALKRKEKLMAKYVEKERKERSIYLHAEGYMCPWVGGTESTGGVLGAGAAAATLGQGGALLKGLKQTGFGGRSYSARTMRNRGRATKKTGPWAA